MAAFNKINSFVEALAEKAHNLGADTIKVVASNTAPAAGNTQLSDIVQIAAGNGYATGGTQLVTSSSAQSSGTYKLVLADATWIATGGSIGPMRYFAIYNDTATNDELIGWYDRGSSITIADGDSFTVDLDPTTGILTLV